MEEGPKRNSEVSDLRVRPVGLDVCDEGWEDHPTNVGISQDHLESDDDEVFLAAKGEVEEVRRPIWFENVGKLGQESA